MAVSTTVEIRGWQESESGPETCIFNALQRVLKYDEGSARRLADEFAKSGRLNVHAPSRESAEDLNESLQGLGALTILEPTDAPVTLCEVHSATWGSLVDDSASCDRLTPTHFRVRLYAPPFDVMGTPTPRPNVAAPFSLAGIRASRTSLLEENEDDVVLDIELIEPMQSVTFVPDSKLAKHRGVSLETAIRLAGGTSIVNWISEDVDHWYFYFFCFGPNCKRVSKSDGVCTRISRSRTPP